MNSFNKNKEVVSICKNYYTIVNSEVYKNDIDPDDLDMIQKNLKKKFHVIYDF